MHLFRRSHGTRSRGFRAVWTCLATLFALAIPVLAIAAATSLEHPEVRIGYITDIHHNDAGRRAGDGVEALQGVIAHFNQLPLAFLVHGGDFLDRNCMDPESELERIEAVFQSGIHKGYHVLGNHDYDVPGGVDRPKEWFIERTGMPGEYYHRDKGHVRFLFLNSNSEARTESQLRWLEDAIRETRRPVVVFSHHPIAGSAGRIRAFREILSRHGEQVVAAITGHQGRITNTVDEKDGVLYYSMAHFFQQVPTYAVITIGGPCGRQITIEGFGLQSSFHGTEPREIGANAKAKDRL